MKIVEVGWLDACSETGYYDKRRPEKHALIKCHTVGFLKVRNKEKVVLVTECFDDGEERHIHVIPRKMVTDIKVLREK